jgi:hypothetical protein
MADNPKPLSKASPMDLALEFYGKRSQSDMLEGIRFDDKNRPGNKIIVVSEAEFYSVPETKIDPEGAEDGRPHRVWIEKGTKVWRSQETTLELEGEATVKHKELPNAIDQHFSTRLDLSGLTEARAIVTAAAPAVPCGSVKAKKKPEHAVMKRCVLEAAAVGAGGQPLPESTSEVTPVNKLRAGGLEPRILAKLCMEHEPFASDGLKLNLEYLEGHKVGTLGEFLKWIECCYGN